MFYRAMSLCCDKRFRFRRIGCDNTQKHLSFGFMTLNLVQSQLYTDIIFQVWFYLFCKIQVMPKRSKFITKIFKETFESFFSFVQLNEKKNIIQRFFKELSFEISGVLLKFDLPSSKLLPKVELVNKSPQIPPTSKNILVE